MQLARWVIVSTSAVLTACAGNGEGLDANGRPEGEIDTTLRPTFESIQANVFTPFCTRCHAGAAAPVGLSLEESVSYAMLVNAPSREVPSLRRVQPGNPDASYLVQKIEGRAAVGGRMPLGGPPLPAETIAVVRQWIVEGAQRPPEPGTIANSKPAPLTSVTPNDELSTRSPHIVVQSDRELDTTLLNAGVVSLRGSGGDDSFNENNEREIAAKLVVRSYSPLVLAIEPETMLVTDRYQLRVSGSAPLALTDLQGMSIDGDEDGIAGGDFVLEFIVEAAP